MRYNNGEILEIEVIPISPYLLLAASIALALINNVALHHMNDRDFRGIGDVFFFNALVCAIWSMIFLALNGFGAISAQTVAWGIGYGCVNAGFLLCKMQSLAGGPVSVTSFIGCSSLLLSTAAGILIFRESVSIAAGIGVALLLVALYLTLSPKSSEGGKIRGGWCALFFLFGGATGILFKLHQHSESRAQTDGMMLCAAITATVLFFVCSFCFSDRRHGPPRIPRTAVRYLPICALASCGYNRLNITLSGRLPSIVFFPTFNGSVVLLTALAGLLIFHEKLQKKQVLGLSLGVIALLFVGGVIDQILAIL